MFHLFFFVSSSPSSKSSFKSIQKDDDPIDLFDFWEESNSDGLMKLFHFR